MTTSTVPLTGRVQLALNVTDLEASIEFYSKLFDTTPAKRKPGYANFSIDSPPLKLVLLENSAEGSLNHLGVEVADSLDVDKAAARLDQSGIAGRVEQGVSCCYAEQDKVWATAPDGEMWEYYTVLAPSDDAGGDGGGDCCA